jgi:hypothetical protein
MKQVKGHGQKFTRKHEVLIAAMMTERTYAAAAAKAGVSEGTLYAWMNRPEFRAAYRRARRELVEGAIGRIQSAAGEAVDALLAVVRTARREGDRVRAAIAILNYAGRGLEQAETLHGGGETASQVPAKIGDVIAILSARLKQVERSELPTAEKARLTASLADAFLRLFGADVLDQRMAAIETVLHVRKEAKA